MLDAEQTDASQDEPWRNPLSGFPYQGAPGAGFLGPPYLGWVISPPQTNILTRGWANKNTDLSRHGHV